MDEKVKELFEGAMSLYNTIESEKEGSDKEYKDADTKIKEVLNGEEPLFIQDDDAIAGMLFQYLNLGYAVCGVKYLDMIMENRNIAGTAMGYALQTLNKNTEELIKYKQLYGELETPEDGKPIEEKELKGISE